MEKEDRTRKIDGTEDYLSRGGGGADTKKYKEKENNVLVRTMDKSRVRLIAGAVDKEGPCDGNWAMPVGYSGYSTRPPPVSFRDRLGSQSLLSCWWR